MRPLRLAAFLVAAGFTAHPAAAVHAQPTQPTQPTLDQILQQAQRDPRLILLRAQAQERRGQREAAARSYEQYLAANPNAPDRAQIEQRIAALRAQPSEPTRPY